MTIKINVLGISGSPIKDGNTEVVLKKTLEQIASDDVTTEFVGIAGKKISGCIHCNFCAKKQTKEKLCSISDDLDEIYPKLLAADVLFIATPVYIGRLSSQLAAMLDRFRLFIHGPVYQNALEDKIGAAFAVCWARSNGVELSLITLQAAFSVHHMIPANPHGEVFGAGILSSIHGEGCFDKDDYHNALQDELGLKKARLLAERAVKLARIVKAGKLYLQEAEGKATKA
jgi:multimeric flavodoxin WrbA